VMKATTVHQAQVMPFYKEEPRRPWTDWRMFGMLVPILLSALGFFVTGLFAFTFEDIQVIPGPVQSWLVILGSGLIVFGAELNTPFTTIETFRKILRKEANGWDYSALVVSLVGTLANLLVTFSARLKVAAPWTAWMLDWGPLLSGIAVACDYYGALVELGFLFGSFEIRKEAWLEERRAWLLGQGIPAALPASAEAEADVATWRTVEVPGKPGQVVRINPDWPPARREHLDAVLGKLNGASATLDAQGLEVEFAYLERALPSRSTTRRYLKIAHAKHKE